MDLHDASLCFGAAHEQLNHTGRVEKQELISGRLTFEDPLTMQEVPGDNHCVEVLGEAWCAWRFDGLARLTLLGNLKKRRDGLLNTSKSMVTTESRLSGF